MSEGGAVTRTTTPIGDPAWLVTGYDTVKALFADPRLGRSHPHPERASRISTASSLGGPEGDARTERADHARMRRVLSGAFSARRMDRLTPEVQDLVDRLIDEMVGRTPPVDLHEALSFPLPALVIARLLGIPAVDRERFRVWSEGMAHRSDAARARTATENMHAFIGEVVDRKRRFPGEDVISDLVAAVGRGELPETEIVELCTGLLIAGHVTTAVVIDKGVMLLDANPGQYEALRRDPSLVAPAVEEILRAPMSTGGDPKLRRTARVRRYANADFEVCGVAIRAGDMMFLGQHEANQDERVFDDPDRFVVDRTHNPHLSFAHGPWYCLGAPLARIELRAVFATLLRRIPTLRLAVPVDQVRRRTDLLIGELAELPVTW